MKKNIVITILAVLVLGLGYFLKLDSVKAAYAYSWTVDGESLSRGSTNKSGNVSWVEDTNYTGGILTLNNYNGGQLKINCNGTSLGHVFAVKLVGQNKISVQDGIGIIANEPIVFIGDGSLEIEAPVPIASADSSNNKDISWYAKNNIKINGISQKDNDDSTKKDEEEIIDNDESSKEAEEKSIDNDTPDKSQDNYKLSTLEICLCLFSIISLLIIIILVIRVFAIQKKLK